MAGKTKGNLVAFIQLEEGCKWLIFFSSMKADRITGFRCERFTGGSGIKKGNAAPKHPKASGYDYGYILEKIQRNFTREACRLKLS
jgi:hypothetical protein